MDDKILLVDDESNVLAGYKRQLRKKFIIDTALGGKQGLEAVKKNGPYAVVVSDLRMPGLDGFQFLARVRETTPSSIRVMLTGHADLKTAMKAINEEKIFQLLTKPCAPDVLAEVITAGIEQFTKNTRITSTVEKGRSNLDAKTILIADDDPLIRDMLLQAFNAYDELKVLTAENGRVAVEFLNNAKIDMVITDLKMPVMNGLKVLSYMNKNHLKIPVVVLTGHGTPEIEAKLKDFDNLSYFEKPLDVNVLIETVFEELASNCPSRIYGIGTEAFLQMVDMEQKTCTLTVKSQKKTGHLYFLKGELIAAETSNLKSEKAAFDIISWNNSMIEVENACRIMEREINRNLMEILMESARVKDDMPSEVTT